MITFNEFNKIIEAEISRIKLGSNPPELYEPIRYALESGGKRIRPALVLASCNLFRNDIEIAITTALAIEVFHNFTLLHDDIMDKADLRRNRPAVHKKWNENVAILCGDAMMIKAYDLIAKAPVESLPKILDLFNQTAAEVCEGQQLDMNFEKRMDVTETEYLEMIRLKTSVLVAASLKMGAFCANASQFSANKLYEFGLNLGLAFQLQDDYLDTFGNPDKFGKKIGGDIVANKKTYMLIKSLDMAKGETREKLISLLSENTIDEIIKINSVVDIYYKLNIKELVKKKMDDYYRLAIDAINAVEVEQPKKAILIEFANTLMVRES
jgi:geranylgeranyl diphosphate synthase, type II